MSDVKLNKIERLKQKCQASEYRSELAGVDWKNVDDETRFYLKNFGIYNIKLRPEIFMIRIRIDGGQITLVTLEKIAEIAEKIQFEDHPHFPCTGGVARYCSRACLYCLSTFTK